MSAIRDFRYKYNLCPKCNVWINTKEPANSDTENIPEHNCGIPDRYPIRSEGGKPVYPSSQGE